MSGAGIFLINKRIVATTTTLYTTKSIGSLIIDVIAVIKIKLAAVTVTPFKKYCIRFKFLVFFHKGKMKKTSKIPGKKMDNPLKTPIKSEKLFPIKDLDPTKAAKLNNGPGTAWSIAYPDRKSCKLMKD